MSLGGFKGHQDHVAGLGIGEHAAATHVRVRIQEATDQSQQHSQPERYGRLTSCFGRAADSHHDCTLFSTTPRQLQRVERPQRLSPSQARGFPAERNVQHPMDQERGPVDPSGPFNDESRPLSAQVSGSIRVVVRLEGFEPPTF